MLHVGLNLIFLVPGQTGGMEVAARETIARLARRGDLRLTAFVNREAAGTAWGPGVEEVLVPVHATNRVQWVLGEQILLPWLARRARVDVLHSMGGTGPVAGGRRRVITIHDLNYKLVPEAHLGIRGRVMALLVPAAAWRSHRVLVDAASTREDLRTHLRLPLDRVDVVPLAAVPPRGAIATPPAVLRARLGLGGEERVVLSVSAKRPHKNLARLFAAMEGLDATLVTTGYRTDHARELERLAATSPARILMPEWVSDADLEGLYALADALAFPSLYEGFGLPVLEAMARDVPVVTSARGSLREVAGDAAVVVDPQSVDAIRDGLRRVLGDPDLRASLRVRGRQQAARFSWEQTAELTAAAYRRA